MFRAKTIIDEMKELSPEIFRFVKKTFINSENDLEFQRLNEKSFKECPNISIDNAVMEKTKKGTVIPLDAEWSDIGSYKSLWENSDKDKNGNTKKGNVIIEKTQKLFLSEKEASWWV